MHDPSAPQPAPAAHLAAVSLDQHLQDSLAVGAMVQEADDAALQGRGLLSHAAGVHGLVPFHDLHPPLLQLGPP